MMEEFEEGKLIRQKENGAISFVKQNTEKCQTFKMKVNSISGGDWLAKVVLFYSLGHRKSQFGPAKFGTIRKNGHFRKPTNYIM